MDASQTGPALAPGMRLDKRFELIRAVGMGALGEVWLAADLTLDRAPVACKILRREWIASRTAVADLKREVLLARRLRHANILPLYTYRDDGAHRFITMEFAEGENLAAALRARSSAFELATVAEWMYPLASALDYAHGEGVLHRDVKPDNILLTKDNQVTLADFGIARTVADLRRNEEQITSQGTLHYISPEQLTGQTIDSRSDQYSLAATAYTLLGGHPPFYGDSLIADIQMKSVPPLDHLTTECNAMLRRALSKTPEGRYPNCVAFGQALRTAALDEPESGVLVPITVDPSADTVALPPEETFPPHIRFGQLLLDSGVITEDQLRAALVAQHKSGRRLGDELTSSGMVTEAHIVSVVARQLGLQQIDATDDAVDVESVEAIGKETLRGYGCIPLRPRANGRVLLAMADPLDLNAINTVEEALGKQVDPVVSRWSALRETARALGISDFGN